MANEWEKVLEGRFDYFERDQPYSEERFSLFEDLDDGSLKYESDLLTRVDSGEFLKIHCTYITSSKYLTRKVTMIKTLGAEEVTEIFTPNFHDQILHYQFSAKGGETRDERKEVPGKYHIATPATVSSILFSQTKRSSALGRDRFVLVSSPNIWSYQDFPSHNNIYIERAHEKAIITLNDNNLESVKFSVFNQDTNAKQQDPPTIFYVSKHFSIPYMVEGQDSITMKIKYLRYLREQDEDLKI